MTRGVIYARYSEGPKQTDQSIEGQVDDCRAYAAAHDIAVIKVYADRHVSGKSVTGRTGNSTSSSSGRWTGSGGTGRTSP